MIKRDGATTSLWQSTTDRYVEATYGAKPKSFDVIVVGGGITGVSTADAVRRLGGSCLLIEARELCFGTTGGTTAHLNTLLDIPYSTLIDNFGIQKARAVATACRNAIISVKANISELDGDFGFHEVRAFLVARDEQQKKELSAIAKACTDVGLQVSEPGNIPIPIPNLQSIVVNEQARFHPTQYVYSLAKRFEEAGGQIQQHCRLLSFKDDKNGVEVETERGTYFAKWLILATHTPPTINLLHLRCSPYRSYALAATIDKSEHFDDLVYDMEDPYHYYRMQEIGDTRYLIAGGKDHRTGDESNTDASRRALQAHIRKHFHVEAITHNWSSQYYESADGLPYIGHLPGHSQCVLTATGFGGNGMTYSSIAAKILAGITTGKKDELAEIFSPTRVKPVAGFRNFAGHNLDVAAKIVTKVFKTFEVNGMADISPGEGRISTIEGEDLAIHKDQAGNVSAVGASCTHMGCNVAWNSVEKSWDCPCHGARFAVDGRMLNGPAVKDLDHINTELVNDSIPLIPKLT